MISSIFSALSGLLQSNLHLALIASFLWGTLSVLLSPCHLSTIPLIVGYISSKKRTNIKESFLYSLLFSFGILITIAVIGFLTGYAGRIIGDIGKAGIFAAAGILILSGLQLWGIISIGLPGKRISGPDKQQRKLTFLFLGLVIGAALGPCTFAYMAPVLAVAFKISSSHFIKAMLYIAFYGLGHCFIIVLAGTFTNRLFAYLQWNEKSNRLKIIKLVSGSLIIISAVYIIINSL